MDTRQQIRPCMDEAPCGYDTGFEATIFSGSLLPICSLPSEMDTDGGQSIVDLAPMNPKGLSCFGTHLFCFNGVWCFRNHVIRVREWSENN